MSLSTKLGPLLALASVLSSAGCGSAPGEAEVARVTEASTASGQYAYSFDPSGLPTSIGTAGGAYSIAHEGGTLRAGTDVYQFDALGRVVAVDDLMLVYGPDGQMAEATRGAQTVSYLYDEYGQRISKSTNRVPSAAFVDEGYVTATELDEPVRVGGSVVGMLRNGVFTFAPTDTRGTVQGDTHGTQRLASPFGARNAHPDIAAAIDYAASEYDADLGANRMGVRDYDARIAQFLQPDSHFLEKPEECIASPVECSLYGYARSNPVSFVDPTGTAGEKTEAAADDKGEPFAMTGYYKHSSENAEGDIPVLDAAGNTLASVSPSFWLNAAMEGSAQLPDGRNISLTQKTVNVDSSQFAPVWERAQHEFRSKVAAGKIGQLGLHLDEQKANVMRVNAFSVEKGALDSHGHVLVPYRSIAADPKVLPQGTRVQIQELIGHVLPDGTKHDGWVNVVDVGGAKKGNTIDLFVGNAQEASASTMPVHIKRQ